MTEFLKCAQHGRAPWTHLMCEQCGKLYDLSDGDAAPDDGMCSCGVRLLPTEDHEEYFSARAVCQHCAEALLKQKPTGPN